MKITDIAKLAGVSPGTVSNALNGRKNVGEETRHKIIQICKEYNYKPNMIGKNLKSGSTKTVLFVFSDFDREFHLKIIHGISDYVYSKGYDLLICTNRNCDSYMHKSITCGCIMLDAHATDEMIIKKAENNYPIVVLDRILDCTNIKSMLVNNYTPEKELVDGLIKKGCRRFAFLGGIDSLDNKERYKAFSDSLREHGLTIKKDDYYMGDYRDLSGYQAAKLLMLTEKLPDALVCANDDMALGAIRAFKENGIRIPENISVTGFDDSALAKEMGLTTVQVPNYERGYIAAQSLIRSVEGEGDCETFKISAKVKWRRTSL